MTRRRLRAVVCLLRGHRRLAIPYTSDDGRDVVAVLYKKAKKAALESIGQGRRRPAQQDRLTALSWTPWVSWDPDLKQNVVIVGTKLDGLVASAVPLCMY